MKTTLSLRGAKRRSNPVDIGIASSAITLGGLAMTIFLSFFLIPSLAVSKEKNVEAIESAYQAANDLSANFTQTTNVALVERTVTKNGTFKFKKGGKLRIEYTGKDPKVYVSDGTTLWIYVPGDDSSLQTFQVSDETVPKEALSFLNGFGKLTKEFAVSQSAAFENIADGDTALKLKPRSKAKHYETLDALFGPDHILKELIVKNTSGNTSRYKFNSTKINSDITDKTFTLSTGKATPDTLPK